MVGGESIANPREDSVYCFFPFWSKTAIRDNILLFSNVFALLFKTSYIIPQTVNSSQNSMSEKKFSLDSMFHSVVKPAIFGFFVLTTKLSVIPQMRSLPLTQVL